MSILPSEFLRVAHQMAAMGTEADHRTAISRAYYAAYHSIIDTLPAEFAPNVSSGSSHEAVIQSIAKYSRSMRPGRTNAALIADSLPRLKRKRKLADYGLGEEVSDQTAKKAVADAEKIIANCEIILSRLDVEAERFQELRQE